MSHFKSLVFNGNESSNQNAGLSDEGILWAELRSSVLVSCDALSEKYDMKSKGHEDIGGSKEQEEVVAGQKMSE